MALGQIAGCLRSTRLSLFDCLTKAPIFKVFHHLSAKNLLSANFVLDLENALSVRPENPSSWRKIASAKKYEVK